MIKDTIKNIILYEKLSANMYNAVSFFRESDFWEKIEKQQKIVGKGFYVTLQEYETKPVKDGKWESHKKYIDIQCIVSGEEFVGYANIENLGDIIEEDAEKDFYYYEDAKTIDYFCVHNGEFIIFFPTDGHKPSLEVRGCSKKVRKVVFKVEV